MFRYIIMTLAIILLLFFNSLLHAVLKEMMSLGIHRGTFDIRPIHIGIIMGICFGISSTIIYFIYIKLFKNNKYSNKNNHIENKPKLNIQNNTIQTNNKIQKNIENISEKTEQLTLKRIVPCFFPNVKDANIEDYNSIKNFENNTHKQEITDSIQSRKEIVLQPENLNQIVLCPSCNQKMNVPYGKWVQVTCPACKHVFEVEP